MRRWSRCCEPRRRCGAHGSSRSTRSISAAGRLRCSTPTSSIGCSQPSGRALPVRPDARLFLEANPEDITPGRIGAWRSLGVSVPQPWACSRSTTVSSARSGRRHDGQEAGAPVEECLTGGFDTVSVDLMFGLPGQDVAAWSENLEILLTLAPGHISCYQLTIHEGTAFGRRRARGLLTEMPESGQADLFAYTHARLADAGGRRTSEQFRTRAPAPLAAQPEVLAACSLPRPGALGPFLRRDAPMVEPAVPWATTRDRSRAASARSRPASRSTPKRSRWKR